MRRIISMLSGLPLLALGLGFALTPASADEDHGCSGDVVVQLDAWLWSRPGHDSYTFDLAPPLGPGPWAVNTWSFDGYEGRDRTSQEHEQWILQLMDGGVVVASVGPTSDIPDGVDHGESIDNLGVVTLATGADSLRVAHYEESTEDGTDSVHAGCVGFEQLEPPPTTTTTTTTTTSVPPGSGSSSTTTAAPPVSTTTAAPPVSTSTVPAPVSTSTSLPGGTTQEPAGGDDGAPAAVTTLGAIPRLRASLDCASRSIHAEITNVGDAPEAVDVFLVSDSVQTGINIVPGSVATVDFPLPASAENSALDLVVSDQSGVADTSSVQVDCEEPSNLGATTSVDCVSGSLVVNLVNNGQEADSVSVIVEQSGLVDTVSLAGGQSELLTIDTGARSAIPLRVVSADGSDVLRRSVPIDCPAPSLSASTSVSCATSEILVAVWNHGDADGTVGVRLDGRGFDGVVVPSADSVVFGLPFEPGSGPRTLELSGAESVAAASGEILIGCQVTGTQSSSPCSSVSIAGSSASTTTIVPAPNPGEPWWVDAGPIKGSNAAGDLKTLRSCATPEVEFSPNCSIGTLAIHMSNSGSIATRLVVLIDGTATSGGIDLSPGADTITAAGVAGARTAEVFEAGRAEPLATLHLSCESGGHGLRTAAYTVFTLSILTSVLSSVVDPRRLLSIFR